MKHKILVTGGAGFIGTHTVIELISAGHEVVIVDNLVNSSKKSIDSLVPEAGKFKIERSESERYYYKSNQEKKIESHYPCGHRRALLCSGTVCTCIQCGSRSEKLCRLLRIGSVTFMYSPAADGDNYRRGKIVFYIRFRLF